MNESICGRRGGELRELRELRDEEDEEVKYNMSRYTEALQKNARANFCEFVIEYL